MSWGIRVQTPLGVDKYAYGPTRGTTLTGSITTEALHLDRMTLERTPSLDSLTGTLLVHPSREPVLMTGRDLVTIYTLGELTGESSSTYYPRWTGYVLDAPNPLERSLGPARVTLRGRRGLFREILTDNTPIASGTDLAAAAETLVTNHAGSAVASVPAQSPIGVNLTARFSPAYRPLSEALDALAEFARQAGTRAEWGINPDGEFFFQAAPTGRVTLSEDSVTGSVVTFYPSTGDPFIRAVRWEIGASNTKRRLYNAATSVDLSTPDLVTYESQNPGTAYWSWPGGEVLRRPPPTLAPLKPIPGVSYYMQTGTSVSSWVGTTQDTTFTWDRIRDDDATSYVVLKAGLSSNGVYRARVRAVLPTSIKPRDVVAVRVVLKEDETSPELPAGSTTSVWLRAAPTTQNFTYGGQVEIHAPTEGIASVDDTFTFGDRARTGLYASGLTSTNYVEVDVGYHTQPSGAPAFVLAVEDFRVFTIDEDALDAAALGEYTDPVLEGFEFNQAGLWSDTSAFLASAKRRGDSDAVAENPIQAVRITLTPERGLESTVIAAPPDTPELRREVAEIRRAAKEAR